MSELGNIAKLSVSVTHGINDNFTEVHLINVYFMGVRLMSVHFISVYLITCIL
jgi:hypothetical protein